MGLVAGWKIVGMKRAEIRVGDIEQADTPHIMEIAQSVAPERTEYVRTAAARSEVLVAREGEVPIGFLVWNREFFGKPFCWLLATAPSHRRQGVAMLLLDALETRCARERVYTSTNRSNAPMHGLLARRGYARRGELDLDPGDAEVFYSKG